MTKISQELVVLITAAGTTWLLLLPFLLVGLGITYAVLRLRDAQSRADDPQLGMKTALHFLLSIGILMLLTGVTIIAVDVIALDVNYDESRRSDRDDEFERFGNRSSVAGPFADVDHDGVMRFGGALIISGFIIAMVNLVVLLGYTNDRLAPIARRTFVGWRFVIHGIVLVTAMTACMIVLMQDKTQWPLFRLFLSVLIVWAPSALIHLILLWWRATQTRKRAPTIDWDEDDA